MFMITSTTDPEGNTWKFDWDDDTGLLKRKVLPNGAVYTWKYDQSCNLLERTLGDGAVWRYEYFHTNDHRNNQLRKEIAPDGGVTEYIRDPNTGLTTRKIDPRGNWTDYTWSPRGELLSERGPYKPGTPPPPVAMGQREVRPQAAGPAGERVIEERPRRGPHAPLRAGLERGGAKQERDHRPQPAPGTRPPGHGPRGQRRRSQAEARGGHVEQPLGETRFQAVAGRRPWSSTPTRHFIPVAANGTRHELELDVADELRRHLSGFKPADVAALRVTLEAYGSNTAGC